MIIVKLENGGYSKITAEEKSILDKEGIVFVGKKNKSENIRNKIIKIISKNKTINCGVLFNRIRCDRKIFDDVLNNMIVSGIVFSESKKHKYNKNIIFSLSLAENLTKHNNTV